MVWLHCDLRVRAERPEPPAYGRFVRCGDGLEFCGGGLGCEWRPHRLSGVDWWGRRYLLRGQVSYSTGLVPLACAVGVAALAEPVLRFVAELAPGALPPYPHALLVLSAGIGGGVWGLALRPQAEVHLEESHRRA